MPAVLGPTSSRRRGVDPGKEPVIISDQKSKGESTLETQLI